MGNTALITGASKRVGRALAEHLSSVGWNVIIHFNSSEKPAKELEEALRNKFPKQKFGRVRADLFEEAEVDQLIPDLVAETGRINLLVNNASVFDKGYISNTSFKLFNNQFNVNLKAPFGLMRDFAIYCKEGCVINIVDTRITSNRTDYAAYSLSKKGLWELTKMAAVEFAPLIRVNAIAPGIILPPKGKGENYIRELAKKVPMQRPGSLNTIMKSVDYILKNDYLTGQLIFADGGENLV